MKILIISSSFRKKGNLEVLCDQFAKGAVEAGNETLAVFRGFLYCLPLLCGRMSQAYLYPQTAGGCGEGI